MVSTVLACLHGTYQARIDLLYKLRTSSAMQNIPLALFCVGWASPQSGDGFSRALSPKDLGDRKSLQKVANKIPTKWHSPGTLFVNCAHIRYKIWSCTIAVVL